MLIVFLLVSFFSSLVGSICGIGGGVIIKPVLDATGTMSVTAISFLSGCTVLSMSIISVAKAMKNSTVKINTKITTWLAIGSVLGGMTGKVMFQIAKQTFGYRSQLDYVVEELKKNPNSRRIMTEIWVPEDLDKMALTPCVHLTQWSVIGNKLYLEVRQRSCDVALGLVANVFQYSILHKLVAMECGLEPAEIIWNIHNVHIYDRHMPELLEQIKRPSIDGATVKIENFKSIYDFKPDDIVVENYQYGDKISYEVAI